MKTNDFLESISAKSGLSKNNVKACMDAFEETIIETIKKNESVTLFGFGCFEPRSRKERIGRSPKNQTAITIPAQKSVGFKVGKVLKKAVNEGVC